MSPYILKTPRLLLRELTREDAEAAFVWLSDPLVNRFMPYPLYTSVDQVRSWISTTAHGDGSYLFGFVRRADGVLIGSGDVGMDGRCPGTWGLGYNLRRDAWNQGYATEATRAMIDFAHKTFGACTFTANHAIANPASGRVMEKCGLRFDHFGEYTKFDGSYTFPAKWYIGHLA